jgi:dihydroorotase-like cyclic amidohydrolase
MSGLLIKNGRVIGDTEVRAADILVENGVIAAIFAPGAGPTDQEILDATGLYVAPGAIDPHMHLGLYSSMGDSYRQDTAREIVGGTTTLIDYHRGQGDYFATVTEEISLGEANSYIDFAISLGLCAKKHLIELPDYISRLGITSFKFFFDKQDIAHTFYGIPPEEALTLDKADLFRVLQLLAAIDERLLLCVHCEDPDLFRACSAETKLKYPDSVSLIQYDQARPDFAESNCLAGAMLINGEINGNLYMVHCSAKKSLEVYRALMGRIPCGRVSIETCPQYLLFDCTATGLEAKVNPALHAREDIEALWDGIRTGVVKTLGTDNVPGDLAQKYPAPEKTLWNTMVGFSTPGLMWPILISEGFHKRGLELSTLSRVASVNSARLFQLPGKGEIRVGYDADLVLLDLDWTRTIDRSLFGFSNFSIYEGLSFTGWPRYTLSRGEIVQKDGQLTSRPGRGKYLFRRLPC